MKTILALFLSVFLPAAAQAAPLPCSAQDANLQEFFAAYTKAYESGDDAQLQPFFTPTFWEKFKDAVPKNNSKHFDAQIAQAEKRNGHCIVRWAAVEKGAEINPRDFAWFHLWETDHNWKIHSISSEGPSSLNR